MERSLGVVRHHVQGRINIGQQVTNDVWRHEIIRENLWHDGDWSKLVNGSGSWRADWECWIGWVRNQVRRGKGGERDDDEKEQGKECFHKVNSTQALARRVSFTEAIASRTPARCAALNKVQEWKFI